MDDGELRQAMAILDAYNAQMESLERQVRLLQSTLEETTRARESLRALTEAKEGDDILVPIGASSFIQAKVTGKKTALVGIGNRYAVEKELDDAMSFMDGNSKEVSETLRRALSTLEEIEKMATELTMAVQSEYQMRQESMQ